jgi:hypothetical protein
LIRELVLVVREQGGVGDFDVTRRILCAALGPCAGPAAGCGDLIRQGNPTPLDEHLLSRKDHRL